MKKLNKKGFTLVELLAVIVILAVIMVITIPTVLGSMSDAKVSAFESAVATIEDYLQKQYDYKSIGNVIGGVDIKVTDFSDTETKALTATQINAAGYQTSDIACVTYKLVNGRVKVQDAKAAGSKFSQGSTFGGNCTSVSDEE